MTRTRTIVAKLVLFDEAMKILRLIAANRRNSSSRRLAAATVAFFETQLAGVAKTRRRK